MTKQIMGFYCHRFGRFIQGHNYKNYHYKSISLIHCNYLHTTTQTNISLLLANILLAKEYLLTKNLLRRLWQKPTNKWMANNFQVNLYILNNISRLYINIFTP